MNLTLTNIWQPDPPMFCAWHLPQFPLQALDLPPHPPAVVVDGSPQSKSTDASVLHLNASAAEHSIHSGQTLAQALARYPRLHIAHRQPSAESQLQTQLLQHAENYTPDYESSRPGLILLDLTSSRPPADWLDLARQMHQSLHNSLARQHADTRIGLAHNADLAILAAHLAQPLCQLPSHPVERRDMLHPLPITALSPGPKILSLLQLWGIHHIGAFTALPRSAVAQRLGTEGLQLHDLATGKTTRLLQLVRPETPCHAERDLHDSPLEALPPLLHHLQSLLEELCSQLATQWLQAGAIHLELLFDDATSHQRQLHLAEPSLHIPTLLRILEHHLEQVSASAPIVHLRLSLTPTRPASHQTHLFEHHLRDPARFTETLSTLQNLLSPDRVGRPTPALTHRPDDIQLSSIHSPPTPGPATPIPLSPPIQRFRPPKPASVELKQKRPVQLRFEQHNHLITQAHGPWKLSGHWWQQDASWSCQLWHVITPQNLCFHLQHSPPQQWHVVAIQN